MYSEPFNARKHCRIVCSHFYIVLKPLNLEALRSSRQTSAHLHTSRHLLPRAEDVHLHLSNAVAPSTMASIVAIAASKAYSRCAAHPRNRENACRVRGTCIHHANARHQTVRELSHTLLQENSPDLLRTVARRTPWRMNHASVRNRQCLSHTPLVAFQLLCAITADDRGQRWAIRGSLRVPSEVRRDAFRRDRSPRPACRLSSELPRPGLPRTSIVPECRCP